MLTSIVIILGLLNLNEAILCSRCQCRIGKVTCRNEGLLSVLRYEAFRGNTYRWIKTADFKLNRDTEQLTAGLVESIFPGLRILELGIRYKCYAASESAVYNIEQSCSGN